MANPGGAIAPPSPPLAPPLWLTVIYDDHWWLTKCLQLDREHQDVKVECMHPSGPTVNFHPKHGRRDVCFCLLKDILMKLTGSASPLQSSRTRELYSITPDVMDFIEHKHVHRTAQCLIKGALLCSCLSLLLV